MLFAFGKWLIPQKLGKGNVIGNRNVLYTVFQKWNKHCRKTLSIRVSYFFKLFSKSVKMSDFVRFGPKLWKSIQNNVRFKGEAKFTGKILVWVAISERGFSKPLFPKIKGRGNTWNNLFGGVFEKKTN